ncbi:MAG: glycosyltransferase family 9 protein [Xanthobacteraceae bacterium]
MTATRLDLPPRARILVVVLRRLGDVLLATPLIRSLRRAWPEARIEALVFAGTEGILAGNPDLDDMVVMPARPTTAQSLALARQLFGRYDLAVSTQSGDRPTLFAMLAGRRHLAPVSGRTSGRIFRAVLTRCVPAGSVAQGVHRVEEVLRLADALGIARVGEVVCPAGGLAKTQPRGPYAVVHAAPMFRYKQWHADGWRALARALIARGLAVIATGGPSETDRRYLDALWAGDPAVQRLDGILSWPDLAALIAGAKIYVGPDTSVTHLAAATGCPTVALYGPTDPRLWGPWPAGGLAKSWAASDTVQRRSNVWLVQNPLPCLPCQLEGCERHIGSFSRCLDELPAAAVIGAVDAAIAAGIQPGEADALPSTPTPA